MEVCYGIFKYSSSLLTFSFSLNPLYKGYTQRLEEAYNWGVDKVNDVTYRKMKLGYYVRHLGFAILGYTIFWGRQKMA